MTGISVIVAEDEGLIRLALNDLLESEGYNVASAASGEAALSLLHDASHPYAGLVTDVRLGDGADGWALARQARDMMPEICVVYLTGDSAADWPVQGVPGSIVLQKPVVDAQLLAGISTLLRDRARLP